MASGTASFTASSNAAWSRTAALQIEMERQLAEAARGDAEHQKQILINEYQTWQEAFKTQVHAKISELDKQYEDARNQLINDAEAQAARMLETKDKAVAAVTSQLAAFLSKTGGGGGASLNGTPTPHSANGVSSTTLQPPRSLPVAPLTTAASSSSTPNDKRAGTAAITTTTTTPAIADANASNGGGTSSVYDMKHLFGSMSQQPLAASDSNGAESAMGSSVDATSGVYIRAPELERWMETSLGLSLFDVKRTRLDVLFQMLVEKNMPVPVDLEARLPTKVRTIHAQALNQLRQMYEHQQNALEYQQYQQKLQRHHQRRSTTDDFAYGAEQQRRTVEPTAERDDDRRRHSTRPSRPRRGDHRETVNGTTNPEEPQQQQQQQLLETPAEDVGGAVANEAIDPPSQRRGGGDDGPSGERSSRSRPRRTASVAPGHASGHRSSRALSTRRG